MPEQVAVDDAQTVVVPYFASEDATIYHADCRHILPLLKAGSIDLIVTDPPYGHRVNSDGDLIHRRELALGSPVHLEARPIANDGPEADELICWSFKEWRRLLGKGCCCCCFGGGGGPDPQFARWAIWMAETFDFKQMIIWDKGPMGMGWHYRRSYEAVLVGMKQGAACRWYDQSSRVENVIRDVPKVIPMASQHPFVKPVKLIEHFIQLHTTVADVVLDPFMGSGTTLVAAVNGGRRAIGIESEERFCEMAALRLSQGVLAFEDKAALTSRPGFVLPP